MLQCLPDRHSRHLVIEPVVLCWAHPGDVSGRFMDSVLRLMFASQEAVRTGVRPDPVIRGYRYVEGGPRIASSRNRLVRDLLNAPEFKDVEWFLMLDADMVFDESLLPALFEGVRDENGTVRLPIVGGLCFGGGHGVIVPTMYSIVDPKENGGDPVRVITDFEDGEIVEVDATGAACLLVHRGVYEALAATFPEPSPWFSESVYLGHEFGEDWTFCLRARSLGFQIHVNTNAKVGHMKSVMMDENMWRTGRSNLRSLNAMPGAEESASVTKLVIPDKATITQLNREQRRAMARNR